CRDHEWEELPGAWRVYLIGYLPSGLILHKIVAPPESGVLVFQPVRSQHERVDILQRLQAFVPNHQPRLHEWWAVTVEGQAGCGNTHHLFVRISSSQRKRILFHFPVLPTGKEAFHFAVSGIVLPKKKIFEDTSRSMAMLRTRRE